MEVVEAEMSLKGGEPLGQAALLSLLRAEVRLTPGGGGDGRKPLPLTLTKKPPNQEAARGDQSVMLKS